MEADSCRWIATGGLAIIKILCLSQRDLVSPGEESWSAGYPRNAVVQPWFAFSLTHQTTHDQIVICKYLVFRRALGQLPPLLPEQSANYLVGMGSPTIVDLARGAPGSRIRDEWPPTTTKLDRGADYNSVLSGRPHHPTHSPFASYPPEAVSSCGSSPGARNRFRSSPCCRL